MSKSSSAFLQEPILLYVGAPLFSIDEAAERQRFSRRNADKFHEDSRDAARGFYLWWVQSMSSRCTDRLFWSENLFERKYTTFTSVRTLLGGYAQMSELWSVARVAKYLDVSKKRVYQLIQMGRLESLKLSPRNTRITRESVERLVEEGKRRQRDELGLDYRPVGRVRRVD